jgi:hypothetical protein
VWENDDHGAPAGYLPVSEKPSDCVESVADNLNTWPDGVNAVDCQAREGPGVIPSFGQHVCMLVVFTWHPCVYGGDGQFMKEAEYVLCGIR